MEATLKRRWAEMEAKLARRWEEKEAQLMREREDIRSTWEEVRRAKAEIQAEKAEEKQRVAEERRVLAQLVADTRDDVVHIDVGPGCAQFAIKRWRLTQVAGSKLATLFSGVRMSPT
jgi:hypothetical protein